MSWEDLKVLMLEEYYPKGENQKLEQEFWNLKMTGSDIVAYTTRFSDLLALCPGMVNPELKKMERYVLGIGTPDLRARIGFQPYHVRQREALGSTSDRP